MERDQLSVQVSEHRRGGLRIGGPLKSLDDLGHEGSRVLCSSASPRLGWVVVTRAAAALSDPTPSSSPLRRDFPFPPALSLGPDPAGQRIRYLCVSPARIQEKEYLLVTLSQVLQR